MIKDFFEKVKSFFAGSSAQNIKSYYEVANEKIELLQKFLNYPIENPDYYIKALTHRSFLEISEFAKKSNERIEYLGDSVLGLIVAEYLFKLFPDEEEGFLTKTRSNLVSKEALAKVGEKNKFFNYVLYNKRFINNSHEGMKTILSDALEALIGAIYLDKGLETAREFVTEKIIKPNLDNRKMVVDRNYKGQLLEFTHAHKLDELFYSLKSAEGPDHKKEFTVEVLIGNKLYGIGKGKNKKSAEQQASKVALENLKKSIKE